MSLRDRIREAGHDASAVRMVVLAASRRDQLRGGEVLEDEEYACIGGMGERVNPEWLAEVGISPGGTSPPDITRPLGRLALRRNYRREVEPRLQVALDALGPADASGCPLRVYLAGSSGGALGGALVPDIASAIRALAGEHATSIDAALFLPSVHADDLRDDFVKMEALKSNTYATLLEFEHILSPPARATPLPSPPLLDRCYLLGRTNETLRHLDSSGDVVGMLVDFLLMESLASPEEWWERRQREDERRASAPTVRGRQRLYSSFAVTTITCSDFLLADYAPLRLLEEILDTRLLAGSAGEIELDASVVSFLWRSDLDEQRLRNDSLHAVQECLEAEPESDFGEQEFDSVPPGRFSRVFDAMLAREEDRLSMRVADELEIRYRRWLTEIQDLVRGEITSLVRSTGYATAVRWCDELLARLSFIGRGLEEEMEEFRETDRRYRRRLQRCRELVDETQRNLFILGKRERMVAIAREYVREIRGHYQNAVELSVRDHALTLLEAISSHLQEVRERTAATWGRLADALREVQGRLEAMKSRSRGLGARGFRLSVLTESQVDRWYQGRCRSELEALLERLLTGTGHGLPLEPGEDVRDYLSDFLLPIAKEVLPPGAVPDRVLDLMASTSLPPEASRALEAHGVPASTMGSCNAWLLMAVTSCRPFWVYHRDALQDQPFESYTLSAEALDDPRLSEFVGRAPSLMTVPSRERGAICFRAESHGVPAFALGEIPDWKLAYEQALAENRRPLHLCRAWNRLPDLMP